jgi:hypothetical protein
VTAADAIVSKLKRKLGSPCTPVKAQPANSSDASSGSPNALLVGNWFQTHTDGEPPLTQHPAYTADTFDTVVADYLLGSLEHYAAFNEEKMLDMLVASMRDDGVLLFCGRTPYPYPGPEKYDSVFNEAKQIVLDTGENKSKSPTACFLHGKLRAFVKTGSRRTADRGKEE